MNYILILSALALAACDGQMGDAGVQAQGAGTARTYAVDGFEKVELAGSDDVDVRVGPAFSVRAEGPAAVLDQLRIDRDGDTIEIGRRENAPRVDGKARVIVTMPNIAGAVLAGSGTMRVDRVSGDKANVEIAGSGNLMLGQIAVQQMAVEIAGSGTLRAGGTVRTLDVDIAGSGNVDAGGLLASSADVSIAGSGNVRATVNGDAKVSIMGSGDVDLGAGARCQTEKMGSGNVRCGR
jgi:hypothetical protein